MIRILILLSWIGLFAYPLAALSQTPPKLKQYYFVMLERGPKAAEYDADTVTLKKLSAGHMAHLNKMAAANKLVIAGPFDVPDQWRGICIYNCASLEEATQLANQDPAVVAGRMKAIVKAWWAMPGSKLPE